MYSIQEIIKIVSGQPLNASIQSANIQHLLYDSRLLVQPERTLFFAIPSQRNNGHRYVKDLYSNGVRHFMIEQKINVNDYPKANFVLVDNVLNALQKLAKFHKKRFSLPTIGITGSNGKTIIKEWLYQLLSDDFEIVRSPKSYNSQIGVPISVWQIRSHHDLAIIEAGISKPNEMARLSEIINCDIGIFSNIGDAHSDGFGSISEKVDEKSLLFKNAKTIIYCKDYEAIGEAFSSWENKTFFTWSSTENATLSQIKIKKSKQQTQISGIYKAEILDITIPFTDDASIENAIHCWACSMVVKCRQEKVQERFLELSPVALRLELLGAVNNCTIINDSYSADLTSLTIALNFLQQQSIHSKNTVILSDFLEHKDPSNTLYQAIADLLIQKNINRLIAIGHRIAVIQELLSETTIQVQYFQNTEQFLHQLSYSDFQSETILIKGARAFQFEKIANRLAQKVHQTTLEINLNALIHNLNIYRSLLRPTTKTMVMVKASAYGSGSSEVAKLLEYNRVDYLAVAYSDEGVELRKSGVNLPILILNPEPVSFDTIIRHGLEPEIYNFNLLTEFTNYLASFALTEPYPIHIKVDTGMHRLGFESGDENALAQFLNQNKSLKVQSIFSHLAGSDAQQFDDFTQQQIEQYQEFYQNITAQIGYQPIRHILNSGGIVRFSAHQMDMVRLGIGIYGIDSSRILQSQLQTVSTLKATISQIKNIPPNETIGYNRSRKATKPMRSATISIGYADGLMRHAGNGKVKVLIRGQLAPIIGNVCMDMSMIDVTDIPLAQEGDEVIIFGASRDIRILAKQLNTIPYEVFTNISGRVKRVYFQE